MSDPSPEAPATPSVEPQRKPEWLKVKAPGGERYTQLKHTLRRLDLHTVCEEARCPNVAECWGSGTATVMLLGSTCTRGCRFCAVTTGNPKGAVDPREPEHVARAIAQLGLKYVVLTMVDRDDLLDGGASHMARAVTALREHQPELIIEALVGDFGGHHRDVDVMVEAGADVFAHNVEVVRRLTPSIRDPRCRYDRSLDVLHHAKSRAPERFVKSSIMVGLGERPEELLDTLADLRAAGVDIVTLGQYLRPTPKHAPVHRYVPPEEFKQLEVEAMKLGFLYVAAGPLVRSSYHAAEGFIAAKLRPSAAAPEPLPAHLLPPPAEPSAAPLEEYGPKLVSPRSLVRRPG